jgi:hypothetical protein
VHVSRVRDRAAAAAYPSAPLLDKLPDHLTHVKFSSLAWTHDSKGFFYHT